MGVFEVSVARDLGRRDKGVDEGAAGCAGAGGFDGEELGGGMLATGGQGGGGVGGCVGGLVLLR